MKCALSVLAFWLVLFPASGQVKIPLAWDLHPDTNVTAYRLFWVLSPLTNVNSVLISGRTNTTHTLTNMVPGSYRLNLTAVSPFGESLPSPDLLAEALVPAAPTQFRLRLTAQGASILGGPWENLASHEFWVEPRTNLVALRAVLEQLP